MLTGAKLRLKIKNNSYMDSVHGRSTHVHDLEWLECQRTHEAGPGVAQRKPWMSQSRHTGPRPQQALPGETGWWGCTCPLLPPHGRLHLPVQCLGAALCCVCALLGRVSLYPHTRQLIQTLPVWCTHTGTHAQTGTHHGMFTSEASGDRGGKTGGSAVEK